MRKLFLLVVLACSLMPSQAQTIVFQFGGDTGAGTFAHPNPALGANGTYVMESTQQNVNIYNYAGTLQSSTSIATFIGNASLTAGQIRDPRLVYDSFISRWLFVCSCVHNFLIVSSGSDPTTSTWKGVQLSSRTGDLSMKPGFDKNWVYISEFDGTVGHELFAIPQGDVAWSGGGNVVLTHMVSSSVGYTLDTYPEIDLNASKGVTDPGYFVSRAGEAQNGTNVAISVAIETFTPTTATAGGFSTAGSPTTIPTAFVYNTPTNPAQPSSPALNGIESHRPFSAFVGGGTDLWVAWPSGPKAGTDNNDLFFVFDVAIPALTLRQSTKVSDPTLAFLFPSLATDSSGNAIISATGVSSGQDASIYTWYHLTTDGAGVLHGPNLATTGTAVYNCNSLNPVDWGTYSSMVNDTSDQTKVLAAHEYANSSTGCQWQTQVLQLQVPVITPPSVAPAATILAKTTE